MKNRNIILTSTLLALGFFAFSPIAQAACPSPNQGCAGGNTADGQSALASLTTGLYNSAFGIYSLLSLTDGSFNTGVGAATLLANTGNTNTAVGAGALLSNTSGFGSTAVGAFALFSSTGLGNNTAVGATALQANTTGSFNTAIGHHALVSNLNGVQNTAVGLGALNDNTSGTGNTALGIAAGSNATTGDGNVYLGAGIDGFAGESNTTYIRNINTTAQPGGGNVDFVTVDLTTGKLGHGVSSRRYKEAITPMDKVSEAIFKLKPVTYRYKQEIDRTQAPSFGLIAEEVAEVNPDLVARNAEGQPESIHYEMVNAMVLNEFLKEHKKVQEQQATIAELKSTVARQQQGMEALTAQMKEQAAQIQKVSAQLEVSKPATKMVLNR